MAKEKLFIRGLSGKRALRGSVTISGAKNAAVKAMAASLLFADPLPLENVPDIEDVSRVADLLRELGADVKAEDHACTIDASNAAGTDLATEISKRLRASIVLSGPMLARNGVVRFPHPGGCVIGERPIDLFIEGYKKMGADVVTTDDGEQVRYVITAPNGKLRGADIFFRIQSVTGTETFMMAAVLAEGETVIRNAALEPEIACLAQYLNNAGAKIEGAGTPTIRIRGGGLLRASGRPFIMPPDRIEAGSFLILAALAGEDVEICRVEPRHLEALIELLSYSGVRLEIRDDVIRVRNSDGPKKSVNLKTHEYPGFPTDLQAPMTVFLTQALGEGLVFETIFEGRLNYTESLKRMGADITMMDPHRVLVKGPTPLSGKELESPDLRAGLAFIIAAIIARGESVIHNVYNIDRGYERIEERLRAIGADVTRLSAESPQAVELHELEAIS